MVASSIAVVAMRNPLWSSLALVVNLLTVAGLFAQLDAHFLFASQIIVYAGAIMVLVVFVIMLLNLKFEQYRKGELPYLAAAVAVGLGFLLAIAPLLEEVFRIFPSQVARVEGTTKSVGELLYTEYVYTFEAASVLIMAAIVGAVMLAKREYRTPSAPK